MSYETFSAHNVCHSVHVTTWFHLKTSKTNPFHCC